jgi:hypothetical protein
MDNRLLLLVLVFGLFISSGCLSQAADQLSKSRTDIVGGYTDDHGCVPSAGYMWCTETQKCYRPWEEPCIGMTPVDKTTIVGGDKDEHGCIGSAGYSWCEATQKCYRPWEENCTEIMPGSDRDEHGCIGSAGYVWCEKLGQCIRPWDTTCPAVTPINETECRYVQGHIWCAPKQKCIVPSEENCSAGTTATEVAMKLCNSGEYSAVYTCGGRVRAVSKLDGGGNIFFDITGALVDQCPLVAPDSMTARCKELMWNNSCDEKQVC